MTNVPERILHRFRQNRGRDGTPLYVVDSNECWIWQRALNANGYGALGWQEDGRVVSALAHRVSYIAAGHTIPDGYEVDHVKDRGCINKACINPPHLEAVTGEENNRRAGNSRRTHCCRGHLMDEANMRLYRGTRHCRACKGARRAERKARGLVPH